MVALPSLSCMLSPWCQKCTLCSPWIWVGPILERRDCENACPEGCCAGNGIFFSKCIFKAWARPGQPDQMIYWQVNISTASTAEQRILRVLNISYPLDELGFAWIVPKGSTQTTLCWVLSSALRSALWEFHLSASQLHLPRQDIDFSFPLYLSYLLRLLWTCTALHMNTSKCCSKFQPQKN